MPALPVGLRGCAGVEPEDAFAALQAVTMLARRLCEDGATEVALHDDGTLEAGAVKLCRRDLELEIARYAGLSGRTSVAVLAWMLDALRARPRLLAGLEPVVPRQAGVLRLRCVPPSTDDLDLVARWREGA